MTTSRSLPTVPAKKINKTMTALFFIKRSAVLRPALSGFSVVESLGKVGFVAALLVCIALYAQPAYSSGPVNREEASYADSQAQQGICVEVSAKKGEKKKWLLVPVGPAKGALAEVSEAVKRALNYTELLGVDVRPSDKRLHKQEVLDLKKSGYTCVIFVEENKDYKTLEWRAYDTNKGIMQKGYSVKKEGTVPRWWGYTLADSIVELAGQRPFASCKLAYCQTGKNTLNEICIADFDGSHPQVLSKSKRQLLGLCWNKDEENPTVLFSRYTPLNIQLVSAPLRGGETIASNFDGLNMQPTFSADGKEVVLCLSRDGSSQLYHYGYNQRLKKVGYTRLTYNQGNNIYPTFLNNGDLIFCSDFEVGNPHLYYFNRKDDSIERLTSGAASSSPSYNCATHKVAFTKMIDGIMQICSYDLKTKKERQLTFDKGHKQECNFSPCGNYLVYGVQDGAYKRIISYSLLTKTKKILTPGDVSCSYPSWSIIYRQFSLVA